MKVDTEFECMQFSALCVLFAKSYTATGRICVTGLSAVFKYIWISVLI